MYKVLGVFCGLLLMSAGLAHAAAVTLAWDYTGTGHAGFVLEQKTGTAGTYADVLGVSDPAQRSATLNNVPEGQIYCWRLVAVSGVYRSGPSNEVCQAILNTPTNLRIVPTP